MNTPYSYIRTLALTLLSAFLLAACVADRCDLQDKPQETGEPGNSASEQPIPKGYKPVTIELELNTRMAETTPLRNAVSCDEDPEYLREHPEQSLRAIDLETSAQTGKVQFKFATKSGDNMIVILSKKDPQGKPINTIYLDHVRYKGNGDNTFQIPRQRLSGIALMGSAEKLEPGSKDWYVMCIYDNPKHPFFRKDNQGIKMTAATWNERLGYEAPISFSTLRSSRNTSVSDIEIPFFSEWTPVQISDDRIVANTPRNPIRLKMPGVLLRVEVRNKSSFPILMKGLKVETNVIHANVTYDLAPDKLPRIGQGSVLSSLSWSPMTPSHVSASGNTLPTLESIYMKTEDLVMMGPSLITYRNYEKQLAGHPNIEQWNNRIMDAQSGRLPQDLYLWGMPITDQETKRFDGKEQIPMTAVYTSYTSQERRGYVLSDDKDFDTKILRGDKPAPGGCSQLSFVSATKLRDKQGKPLTGIVPLQVVIEDRAPSPLDYMCRTTPILQPKDTHQTKPTFKEYKLLVTANNDPCYFSFDYVTNQQPDGSYQNDRLRLRYKKDAAPIAGYHIPSQDEMSAVVSSRIIIFGNPRKANDYQGNHIEYTTDIFNPTWQIEQLRVKNQSFYGWGLFRKTSPEETALLTGTQVGQVRTMYVGLRGLKEGKLTEEQGTFHYSPAMGVYLYSAGDNKFWLQCIPLSRHWVKRFNNQRNKFADYVMSGHFFYFFKDNRIRREIHYAANWNGARKLRPAEKWGSYYWLSLPREKQYYRPRSSDPFLCFGFEWDSNSHGGNLIFHPSYENGARNPTGSWNGFPVILFYDKLWEP